MTESNIESKTENWVSQCMKYNKKISMSQGGQDGILEFIFKNVPPVNDPPYYIEFGYIGPKGSNTWNLYQKGWKGLIMDGGVKENEDMNIHKEFITSENICSLFEKYGVPEEPDYVSIDIDTCDLWVFRAITEKYRPRVLTVEYNPHYSLEDAISFPNDPKQTWHGDRLYGASLKALHLAAKERGYSMIAYVRPLDVFLVRNDLLEDQKVPDIEFFRKAHYMKNSVVPDNRYKNVVDFEVYLETGSMEKAKEAAKRVWPLLSGRPNQT